MIAAAFRLALAVVLASLVLAAALDAPGPGEATYDGTEFVEPEPALVPAKPKTPRRKRPSMTGQLVMHTCAKCSDELGYEYHQMVHAGNVRRPTTIVAAAPRLA